MAQDVLAEGERMWFGESRMDGTYYDPTMGRDDWIDQAMFDHGGYIVYDITAPNAIMPVPEEVQS